MKFPSIIKIPRHQRFNIQPRYYDPVKEDLEQRVSRISKELKNGESTETDISPQLKGAFKGRFYERRAIPGNSNLLQFFIISILAGGIFGYIYFGEIIFYFLLLAAALYIYLRVRRIF
jgi:hypothetical protein